MIALKILIPNLNRRQDKWNSCYKTLKNKGVPDSCIIRVSSYDWRDYFDGQNYCNLTLAKSAAIVTFNGTLPKCLSSDKDTHSSVHYLGEFAWKWTWYRCLNILARLNSHEYGLLLLDDVDLLVPFNQLMSNLKLLNATHKIRMIQLTLPVGRQSMKCRRIVPENPVFQFGLNGKFDIATIYSSHGASFMMDYANEHPHYRDSCFLTAKLQNESDQTGLFAISALWPNITGFARWHRGRPTGDISDRDETRHLSNQQ